MPYCARLLKTITYTNNIISLTFGKKYPHASIQCLPVKFNKIPIRFLSVETDDTIKVRVKSQEDVDKFYHEIRHGFCLKCGYIDDCKDQT